MTDCAMGKRRGAEAVEGAGIRTFSKFEDIPDRESSALPYHPITTTIHKGDMLHGV